MPVVSASVTPAAPASSSRRPASTTRAGSTSPSYGSPKAPRSRPPPGRPRPFRRRSPRDVPTDSSTVLPTLRRLYPSETARNACSARTRRLRARPRRRAGSAPGPSTRPPARGRRGPRPPSGRPSPAPLRRDEGHGLDLREPGPRQGVDQSGAVLGRKRALGLQPVAGADLADRDAPAGSSGGSPARPSRCALLVERGDALAAVLAGDGGRHATSSSSMPSASGTLEPAVDGALRLADPHREFAQISFARPAVASASPPAGTTRFTMPHACASSTGQAPPGEDQLLRARHADPPGEQLRPPAARHDPDARLRQAEHASSLATIRSHESASSNPPPSAKPKTDAIVGWARRGSSRTSPASARGSASQPASSSPFRSLRSAPTQNARSPSASRTTTQRRSSPAAGGTRAATSIAISPEIAFSASGRRQRDRGDLAAGFDLHHAIAHTGGTPWRRSLNVRSFVAA